MQATLRAEEQEGVVPTYIFVERGGAAAAAEDDDHTKQQSHLEHEVHGSCGTAVPVLRKVQRLEVPFPERALVASVKLTHN